MLIVTPIMVAYEVIKTYGWLEKPWPFLSAVLSRLGLGPAAFLPLLAGLCLGIVYGAGMLVAMAADGKAAPRERLAVGAFLVVCHAVFEDTAVFVLLGASGPAILGVRLVGAVAVCMILASPAGRWLLPRNLPKD